jgi:hypothetical protein
MTYEPILILRISSANTVAVFNAGRMSLSYLDFDKIDGYEGQDYAALRPLGLRPALDARALYGANGAIDKLVLISEQPYLDPSQDPRLA